jgi:recombination protein RecA
LGQGRDSVKQIILDNPELMLELELKIKDALATPGSVVPMLDQD